MKTVLFIFNQTAFLSWLLVFVFLIILVFIIKWALKKINERSVVRVEEERKSALIKAEAKKRRADVEARRNRINKISSSFSPTPLFNCDIVFIAELYNAKSEELTNFFSFTKVLKYELANFVVISEFKNQLVYVHSISKILKMYNGLFKETHDDYFLAPYLKSINKLRNYVNEHQSFKGAFSLKRLIDKECPNFPMYNWSENWNMEGVKIKN